MATSTTTEKRIEQFKSTLISSNGKPVPAKYFMESMGFKSSSNLYTMIMNAKRKYPGRIKNEKGGKGYVWLFDDEEKNKFPDHKTEEGYPDPTATAAMSENESKPYIESGSVWKYGGSNGKKSYYMVVAPGIDESTLIPLYPYYSIIPKDRVPNCSGFIFNGERWFYDFSRITTKPNKYFLEKQFVVRTDILREVGENIARYLGIKGSEPTVKEVVKEVPVEVIKEIPVEVIKEVEVAKGDSGRISEEEVMKRIEEAVIRERAKIYEEITFKLLERQG